MTDVLKRAEELNILIMDLEFGCPFSPGSIGAKDAEAAERTMQKAADMLRSLRAEVKALRESQNIAIIPPAMPESGSVPGSVPGSAYLQDAIKQSIADNARLCKEVIDLRTQIWDERDKSEAENAALRLRLDGRTYTYCHSDEAVNAELTSLREELATLKEHYNAIEKRESKAWSEVHALRGVVEKVREDVYPLTYEFIGHGHIEAGQPTRTAELANRVLSRLSHSPFSPR